MTNNALPYGAAPPDNWGIAPLKHLATLQNGYVFRSDEWKERGTPIIRIENLNGSNRFNYSTLGLPNKHVVTTNDLLFSWSGNPGTSFGPFRWRQPGRYYLNQHIFKVSVHGCASDWLYWALKAATHWIERELTSGMIGMVHVTKEELAAIPIPVPPLDQQRRIANFLDAETMALNSMQAKQETVLARIDERKRAMRDQLVDQLAAEVGEAPLRRWITRIEQGSSPQCEGVAKEDGEWGVLKLSAVKDGLFDSTQNKRLPDETEVRREYEVHQGDLLVTRANTPPLVGDVAVIREQVARLLLPDLIYRVGLIKGVDARFVAQILLSSRVRQPIEAAARGSSQSMVKIRGEDIKGWLVPAASSSRQKDLVREMDTHLDTTSQLRAAVRRSLSLLAERKQALITAAVTGQIDVSTASGR